MDTDAQPGFKLFENACAYSTAAKLLSDEPAAKCTTVYTHLSQSAAIYAGLAIDYYLKTLYFLQHKKQYNEHGKTPHDFSSIYSELKHRIQKDLEILFTGRISKIDSGNSQLPRDLRSALKHWTDAFTHLRVTPNQFTGKSLFFFHEMEDVFKTWILNVQPEWGYRTTQD